MEKNKTTQRDGYIDVLKCLAIIFVVIGHIDGMKIGLGAYDTLRGHIEYTFQMPLFFFMSGMFAHHGIDRGERLLSLLWRKTRTLAWYSILFFIILAIFEHRKPSSLINGFGYYWFTFTLFECFCIYYILAFFLKRNKNIGIVLIIISVVFVCLLASKLDIGLPILEMNNLTKYFQYFVLGTLFVMYPTVGDKILRDQRIYAFCIIVFVIFYVSHIQQISPLFFT